MGLTICNYVDIYRNLTNFSFVVHKSYQQVDTISTNNLKKYDSSCFCNARNFKNVARLLFCYCINLHDRKCLKP